MRERDREKQIQRNERLNERQKECTTSKHNSDIFTSTQMDIYVYASTVNKTPTDQNSSRILNGNFVCSTELYLLTWRTKMGFVAFSSHRMSYVMNINNVKRVYIVCRLQSIILGLTLLLFFVNGNAVCEHIQQFPFRRHKRYCYQWFEHGKQEARHICRHKNKKRKTLFKNITYYYNIGNTIFTSLIHNLVVIDSAAFPPMHCARCIYI